MARPAEKLDAKHLEENGSDDWSREETEFTPQEQSKIIHRVDRRLVTTTGVMYCISLMDRTNLSTAAIAGMLTDLRLIDYRYSIITLVFFITYVLFQPPATVLCRKIGPQIFLAGITLAWGACMIGFGFVDDWTAMVGLRLLLGVLEAGFFPGCVYLLSTWYSRYDVAKRYSVFYLIGCLASALSGVLAFGLMQMKGLANMNGWRWIFIIEGVLTCLVAIGGYFFLVDFPEKAHKSRHFLSEKECNFIIRRVNKDRGDVTAEPFSVKAFLKPARDLEIWGFAMIFLCLTTVAYAIAYFLPIILRNGLGYSVGAAQCLVAPPYAFAGILMFATSWIGDKYHTRAPVLVFNAIVTLVGLPIMGFHSNNAVRYFGVFLVVAGANANIPACMAYQANNIRGQWKRAFCSATLVGFGGIGGIAGSLVFRSQDSPEYVPGMIAAIVANCIVVVICAILSFYFMRCNKKADQGKLIIGYLEGFRYTI